MSSSILILVGSLLTDIGFNCSKFSHKEKEQLLCAALSRKSVEYWVLNANVFPLSMASLKVVGELVKLAFLENNYDLVCSAGAYYLAHVSDWDFKHALFEGTNEAYLGKALYFVRSITTKKKFFQSSIFYPYVAAGMCIASKYVLRDSVPVRMLCDQEYQKIEEHRHTSGLLMCQFLILDTLRLACDNKVTYAWLLVRQSYLLTSEDVVNQFSKCIEVLLGLQISIFSALIPWSEKVPSLSSATALVVYIKTYLHFRSASSNKYKICNLVIRVCRALVQLGNILQVSSVLFKASTWLADTCSYKEAEDVLTTICSKQCSAMHLYSQQLQGLWTPQHSKLVIEFAALFYEVSNMPSTNDSKDFSLPQRAFLEMSLHLIYQVFDRISPEKSFTLVKSITSIVVRKQITVCPHLRSQLQDALLYLSSLFAEPVSDRVDLEDIAQQSPPVVVVRGDDDEDSYFLNDVQMRHALEDVVHLDYDSEQYQQQRQYKKAYDCAVKADLLFKEVWKRSSVLEIML